MKIIKKLNYISLILITGFNHMFAMIEPQNGFEEGASHYSAREHQIYMENVDNIINEIFVCKFSKTRGKIIDSYGEILKFCAKKRKKIADICVAQGVASKEEAKAFGVYRSSEVEEGMMKTKLEDQDNEILYSYIRRLFQSDPSGLGDGQTITYMRYDAKVEVVIPTETLDKWKSECTTREQFMRKAQEYCLTEEYLNSRTFENLVETCGEDLINQNPGIGTFRYKNGNRGIQINPELTHATLRMVISLNGTSIPIGALSSLALQNSEGEYNTLGSFLIRHAPKNSIEPLLQYAEKNWQDAICWNKLDPASFLESLARFYWAQTIATPYERGSEAIAKWMLNLTARYHSEKLVYPLAFVFRMPFALSIDDFVEYFKENIILENDLSMMLE